MYKLPFALVGALVISSAAEAGGSCPPKPEPTPCPEGYHSSPIFESYTNSEGEIVVCVVDYWCERDTLGPDDKICLEDLFDDLLFKEPAWSDWFESCLNTWTDTTLVTDMTTHLQSDANGDFMVSSVEMFQGSDRLYYAEACVMTDLSLITLDSSLDLSTSQAYECSFIKDPN